MKSLLSSAANTRELGGIPLCGGKITKNGVFWRSDVPVCPTEEDVETLLSSRMTAIIDMRTDAETEKKPNALAQRPEFRYFHFPITEGSCPPESLEAVPESYMSIALAENMPKVMKVIAEAPEGVLFHCTAGKDRTGVVSAVILMACHAENSAIVENYVLSREYNKEKLEAFLAAHPEVDRRVVLANERSMERFIDIFTERFGTVDTYFQQIGLTAGHAEMIRNKLI